MQWACLSGVACELCCPEVWRYSEKRAAGHERLRAGLCACSGQRDDVMAGIKTGSMVAQRRLTLIEHLRCAWEAPRSAVACGVDLPTELLETEPDPALDGSDGLVEADGDLGVC